MVPPEPEDPDDDLEPGGTAQRLRPQKKEQVDG